MNVALDRRRDFVRVVAPLALLLALACAHAPSTPAPEAEPLPWYGDLHALAEQAARVRGMTLTQKFEVVPMDDAQFFAEYDAIQREASRQLLAELNETLRALMFSPVDLEAIEGLARGKMDSVRSEQVVAFYHFATDRLVVRRTVPAVVDQGGDEVRRVVLAHEVGHVLQDQLGLGGQAAGSFDQALASRAVLEGDANLTSVLVEGARKGLTPQRAVERARLTLSALSSEQIVAAGGFSPKLLAASPLVRDLFLFPYLRGQRFVTDVYAAGGLPLVDQMLKRPPQATEAIFAPQRWLDGRGRAVAKAGPAPRKLGAVLMRSFFESCGRAKLKPATLAMLLDWFERHYVDDSFQRSGDSLAWLSGWDDAEPAAPDKPFETARREANAGENMRAAEASMKALGACLGSPEGDLTTVVEGSSVALGIRSPMEAARLAALPRPPAQPAPLGQQLVPKPRMELAFRVAGQGTVTDGRWAHPKLQLTMDWPEGSKLLDNPASSLTAAAPGASIFGSFLDEETNDRSANGFLNAALGAFFKAARVGPGEVSMATKYEWRDVDLGGVKARETTVSFESVTAFGRVVPMCGGKAALYVVGIVLREDGRPFVERWWSTLRGPAEPPLCREQ